MKLLGKLSRSLASIFVCVTSIACAQTSVAQVDPGFVVTANDDAEFLGRTLFPETIGNTFRFDSAVLDFGSEGVPFTFDQDGFFVPGEIPQEPIPATSQAK